MNSESWIAFIAGLLVGSAIGGAIVYAIIMERAKTMVKTFAYDDAGRLIQVMKEYGV